MRKIFKILAIIVLFSCSRSDSILGTWTVDKVTFEFDEHKGTPEMIQQFGAIEKRNTLIFRNDSIVHITMATIDADYRYTISQEGTIKIEPTDHNIMSISLKDGFITTETDTPIGMMKIVYRK